MDYVTDAYRELFEAHPRPMFVAHRASQRILFVNRAAEKMYGWTRDEMLAMTLRDIRPPEDVPRFELVFAAKKGQTYSRVARHHTKDGRILDVSLEIVMLDFEGEAASCAVVTDITGIHEAERRFKLLVEHSADGIVIYNADNVIEYASPGSERILGFKASEVVGKNVGTRSHPDNNKETHPLPGETKGYIARVTHRDGSWRWIETFTTNLTHDPAIRAFVSNYRDITERKLAEDALVKSAANFRTLIEASPIATFVHDENVFLYANPATIHMLRLHSPADIVGKRVLDFVHPDDREAVRTRMVNTATTGTTPAHPARMIASDGTVIVLEATGLLLEFDGKPSNVVMATDVTQRHEMFTRMATADRMLTVGTLAAGVAHEINNPLAYIGSNVDVLAAELPLVLAHGRSRLSSDDFRALMTDVREGVSRVSRIVRDLLALSRQPDEGTRAPVDVVAVMAVSLKMATNELRHRARIVEDYAHDVPFVEADASKLGQVFLNLLLNAAQAIAEGHAEQNEVKIRITGGERVVIEISDTGTGIPPHALQRIFDPFFTTKAHGVGTGLGLSISDQIVRSLGGEISVESSQGKGTTFRITLPPSRSTAAIQPVPEPAPVATAARVLVIDDEAAVGRALRMLLAPDNDVTVAATVHEALDLLIGGTPFDAILCDLMMPDISGVELYGRLVETAPWCVSKIVFMTGGAFTQQARDFLANLGRPYLDKPFTESQLRAAIDRVMKNTP
ncbi:MAG: PAS domain S-box protein [Kofleriaceae bacterium]